jgi:hypothetical protein
MAPQTRRLVTLVLSLFGLLQVQNLKAQQLATLTVEVTDQAGTGIPSAQITVKNQSTSVKRTAWSDSAGVCVIAGLPAATFKKFHSDERSAIFFTDVMDGADVWVVQC